MKAFRHSAVVGNRSKRPTRHDLNILRSNRPVVLAVVDELEFCIGRVVSDLNLEADVVV